MRRILGIFLLLAIAALLAISLFKDALAKTFLERGIFQKTGARVSISTFHLDLKKEQALIGGLEIENPRGFRGRLLADLPELFVDVDGKSLWKGKLRIQNLRLNLKELRVEKNESGKLNLHTLKETAAPEKSSKPAEFFIKRLELTAGRVVYEDYTQKGRPKIQEYKLGLKKEVFENISDAETLTRLILWRCLKKAGLKNIGVALEALGESLSDVKGVGAKATGEIKKGLGKLKLPLLKSKKKKTRR